MMAQQGDDFANPEVEKMRKEILDLNLKRTQIEEEIKALQEVLSSQRVGMDDPLVDGEGFPRGDIDVYQVRNARSRIRIRSNDARELMKKIESGLNTIHELMRKQKGDQDQDQPPSR